METPSASGTAVDRKALAQVRRQVHRLALGQDSAGTGLVEVADQRVNQSAARPRDTTRAQTPGRSLRGSRLAAVVLAVSASIGRGEAVLARAQAREAAGRAGAPGGHEPFQGAPLEPAVAAGRRERGNPALVGPAAQGVGIDAQEAARLAQREAFGRRAGRRRGRVSDTGSPLWTPGRSGDAGIMGKTGSFETVRRPRV